MWRPEGWENNYNPYLSNQLAEQLATGTVNDVYEAGADAMLEALRRQGNHRENQPFDAPPNTGTWVFLPDEEG